MTDKVNAYRLEVLKDLDIKRKALEFNMRLYAKDFVENEKPTDKAAYFKKKDLLEQLNELEKVVNLTFSSGDWKGETS